MSFDLPPKKKKKKKERERETKGEFDISFKL